MVSGRYILRIVESKSANMDIKTEYQRLIRRKVVVGIVLLFLLFLVFVFSIGVGSLYISVQDILASLLKKDSMDQLNHVIWNIRLPRSIGAVMAGACLGVAGAIMQNILRNPLASPFTLGVSQGAAFGAAFAIIVLGAGKTHLSGNEGVTLNMPYVVVISAFVGSLLSVGFIVIISLLRNVTTESVILSGVALSAFFTAATMFIQYFASDLQVAATVFWTFGDLGKAGWNENAFMLAAFFFSFIYFIAERWSYNAIQWGDEVAASLGVHVKRLRLISMILGALIVSVTTAFLGIIGFVGLIAPHIVRFIVGNDYRFMIPYSALFGALLLLISDIIARKVMSPIILPVGIITSFAGAPLFLYLLFYARRQI